MKSQAHRGNGNEHIYINTNVQSGILWNLQNYLCHYLCIVSSLYLTSTKSWVTNNITIHDTKIFFILIYVLKYMFLGCNTLYSWTVNLTQRNNIYTLFNPVLDALQRILLTLIKNIYHKFPKHIHKNIY